MYWYYCRVEWVLVTLISSWGGIVTVWASRLSSHELRKERTNWYCTVRTRLPKYSCTKKIAAGSDAEILLLDLHDDSQCHKLNDIPQSGIQFSRVNEIFIAPI